MSTATFEVPAAIDLSEVSQMLPLVTLKERADRVFQWWQDLRMPHEIVELCEEQWGCEPSEARAYIQLARQRMSVQGELTTEDIRARQAYILETAQRMAMQHLQADRTLEREEVVSAEGGKSGSFSETRRITEKMRDGINRNAAYMLVESSRLLHDLYGLKQKPAERGRRGGDNVTQTLQIFQQNVVLDADSDEPAARQIERLSGAELIQIAASQGLPVPKPVDAEKQDGGDRDVEETRPAG